LEDYYKNLFKEVLRGPFIEKRAPQYFESEIRRKSMLWLFIYD
jgi:hypothetical protein